MSSSSLSLQFTGPGLTESTLGLNFQALEFINVSCCSVKTQNGCSVLITGLAVARHGCIGRKQKAIISRESTMAAGQTGKVPGAPPRNPTEARSREARRRKKKSKKVP